MSFDSNEENNLVESGEIKGKFNESFLLPYARI
jgi:hypothetical protein